MATLLTLERLVTALEQHGCRVRWRGLTKVRAHCPAHHDRNPSLAIDLRDDTLLLHCFAGCQTLRVLQALGLTWSALGHDRSAAGQVGRSSRVAEYEYTDLDGRDRPALRLVPKFYWERLDASAPSGWRKLDGFQPSLYHIEYDRREAHSGNRRRKGCDLSAVSAPSRCVLRQARKGTRVDGVALANRLSRSRRIGGCRRRWSSPCPRGSGDLLSLETGSAAAWRTIRGRTFARAWRLRCRTARRRLIEPPGLNHYEDTFDWLTSRTRHRRLLARSIVSHRGRRSIRCSDAGAHARTRPQCRARKREQASGPVTREIPSRSLEEESFL